MHKNLLQRKEVKKYPFNASHPNEVQKSNWYKTGLDLSALQQLHTTPFLYSLHSTEQGSYKFIFGWWVFFVCLYWFFLLLLLEFFQAHFIEYSDHCISSKVSGLLDGLSPSSDYI